MEEFKSFADVHVYLSGLMSETRSRRHAYTLDNMKALMEYLGHPQNAYKAVHVAGTSGKTSTAHYLSALLRASGKKVGLSISPHVDEVNERVQINTHPLTEKKFCSEFRLFIRRIAKSEVRPSYFEVLVSFAFWEFAREKVDYAVIEVGLGGLLDGTNVMSRADKVCVITDIGYDHTAVLGKTLEAISAQKAGIILPTNVVFSYDQDEEIMNVLREVCDQQQAELHEIWPLKAAELPKNMPLFQRRNWYLALSVHHYLQERDGLPELDESLLSQTTTTYIPARMEILHYKEKTIILDAAHNPQKLSTLVKSIKHAFPKQPMACAVAFTRTKQSEVRDSLQELVKATSHLIATSFSSKDTGRIATDPLDIVDGCESLGFEAWELVPDPAEALRKLLGREEPVLLVTGSFFLLNHIRPLIMKLDDSTHSRH